MLEDENMRLKRLLRENGISWSSSFTFSRDHADFGANNGFQSTNNGTKAKAVKSPQRQFSDRQTRSSTAALVAQGNKMPHLPMEVQLRVLRYALTSSYPIIDPLSKLISQNLTDQESTRGNQIAIHALAACRAFYAEGTRILWASNQFIFTDYQALSNFANLNLAFRSGIKHITLRIVARYYDDEKRAHWLRDYHPDWKKRANLPVNYRLREENLTRKGFRCYTWTQVIDFLAALRPPYDPDHDKKLPRPRLLPGLESMRIDFVNFPDSFLPFSENELHDVAAHELGCSLNELIVTGIPCCEVGMKASCELTGMVKDDGLFLDGVPSFVQYRSKTGLTLKMLGDRGVSAKVIRPWKKLLKDSDHPPVGHGHSHSTSDLPPAPEETGHPVSHWRKRKSVWKRVPLSRDSEDRKWVEFDRRTGFSLETLAHMYGFGEDVDMDSDDEAHICAKCGEFHSSFDLDF